MRQEVGLKMQTVGLTRVLDKRLFVGRDNAKEVYSIEVNRTELTR